MMAATVFSFDFLVCDLGEVDAIVCDCLYGFNQEFAFNNFDALVQLALRIIWVNFDFALGDVRAGVDALVDDMNGDAGFGRPALSASRTA